MRPRTLMLLAVLALLFLAKAWAKVEPGLVVLCQTGGVHRIPDESNLGSGFNCVLHDAVGKKAVTAAGIIIYDSEGSP